MNEGYLPTEGYLPIVGYLPIYLFSGLLPFNLSFFSFVCSGKSLALESFMLWLHVSSIFDNFCRDTFLVVPPPPISR